MDEVLLRRMVGACVLFGAAFVVTWLLPDAGPETSSGEPQPVVFDLNSGAVTSPAPVRPEPQGVLPQPASRPAQPEAGAVPSGNTGGGWYVQVGSFSSRSNADRALKDMRQRGLPGQVQPVQVGKGTLYRVRVGPFHDEKVARRVQEGLPKTTYLGARVFHVVPES